MTSERSSPGVGRSRFVPVCLAVLAAAGGIAWTVQRIVVKVPELQIRRSVTGFGGSVAVAREGEALDVVAREGDWLRVRTGRGEVGFIKEAAVTKRSLKPATTFNLPGDTRAGIINPAAATKGLEEEALDFASSRNYRTDGVERMMQTHKTITPEEFEQFLAEGGLGSAQR